MTTVQDLLVQWRDAPLAFVREALCVEFVEDWQSRLLRDITSRDRISIRAARGVGKTCAVGGWIPLWFLLTRTPARIVFTANTLDQLSQVIWPELKMWSQRLPPALRDCLDIQRRAAYVRGLEATNFAVARTADEESPEALQGFHAANFMWIVDESSGVPDVVFNIGEGSLTETGARIILASNPTRVSGYFYESHHRDADLWHRIAVSRFDIRRPGQDLDWPEKMRRRWGEDSPEWHMYVLGEFPPTETDLVIPRHLAEAALTRDVEPAGGYLPVWGVDVARFGTDESALAKRHGNVQPEPVRVWRNADTMTTAGIVVQEWRAQERADKRLLPSEILVDVIGLGAGVVDRLYEQGLPVRGVNVAESASVKGMYMRRRDELWFQSRHWFEARDCRICDPELVSELSQVHYSITSTGKYKVESKDEMRSRGLRSPNRADAWNLTFAGGYDRDISAVLPDRYAPSSWRGRAARGSWMSV